jgi:hypothetical protein
MATMLELFASARKVSVPIVVIRTADQQATVQAIRASTEESFVLQWDAANGITGVANPESTAETPGQKLAKQHKLTGEACVNFVDAMTSIKDLPQASIVCALNAHRQLLSSEPAVCAAAVQAVSNLRDLFEKNFRMLVLLGPGFAVPPELSQDVVTLDHELPEKEELSAIVNEIQKAAKKGFDKMPDLSDETRTRAVEAISGLSAFAAKQVAAMSYTEKGPDLEMLWERKRVTIEQTRGCRVWRGGERFKDIIGLQSVKDQLQMQINGRTPIGVVLFLDEIDKVMANIEHDTTNVRMDQFKTMLTEMEDNEWEGMLLAGIPGGGKSLIGKAFGNEAGVPTIALDLADLEGSLVGESEQRLRHMMAVVKAIGGGRAFVIATSNNATVMRPELQRRFTAGFFWVDLLTSEQRDAAWHYYLKKYEVVDDDRPFDDQWTAAEIRNCVRRAWNSGVSLRESARFIVPVAKARADEFNYMRAYATGRYLDANGPGTYSATELVTTHLKQVTAEHALRAMNVRTDKVN